MFTIYGLYNHSYGTFIFALKLLIISLEVFITRFYRPRFIDQ